MKVSNEFEQGYVWAQNLLFWYFNEQNFFVLSIIIQCLKTILLGCFGLKVEFK